MKPVKVARLALIALIALVVFAGPYARLEADPPAKVVLRKIILDASMYQDRMPGGRPRVVAAGSSVSVDVVPPAGTRVTRFRVTRVADESREVGKLKFTYEIVEGNPARGRRYHGSSEKDWAVGDRVRVEVELSRDGKRVWHKGPVVTISAIY